MRVKCIVTYDGSQFHGFQIQPSLRTVQGVIQEALRKITQEEIVIHGSGRTDAGVHANNQVFHFDTNKTLPEKQWKRSINHFMPSDIYINNSFIVDVDFHSRYSASWKEYRYYLNMNEYNPLQCHYIYQYCRELDIQAMKQASKLYLGCHNFASFTAQDPYGNTFRTVYDISITNKEGVIMFRFKGDGFRRYQIRYMVGALIRVGQHKLTEIDLRAMIESEGKIICLHKAPPEGLYLHRVGYGELNES